MQQREWRNREAANQMELNTELTNLHNNIAGIMGPKYALTRRK